MKKKICVLCGKEIVGYGSNLVLFANKGEVCDECNSKYVIPTRFEGEDVSGVIFKPSKMYVIEVRPGEYVKNSKYDTKNLREAKLFYSEEAAKRYISNNLPYYTNIKLVEGCK